jgi:hypothetical protein
VSKGFLIFAQNTDTVDYVHQAYALALSIKYSQNSINSVSLVTSSKIPKKYKILLFHHFLAPIKMSLKALCKRCLAISNQ